MLVKNIKFSELIDNELNLTPTDITLDDLDEKRKEFSVNIDIIHSSSSKNLVNATIKLAECIEFDVFLYDIDEGLGGGDSLAHYWEEMRNIWATLVVIKDGVEIAKLINQMLNYRAETMEFFNEANNADFPRPLKSVYLLPNNSTVEFRFFDFFDNEESFDGLKAIPETLSSVKVEPNTDLMLVFNSKHKKWFEEGIRHKVPTEQINSKDV